MSDDNKTLEILLTTKAELAGAQQLAAQLERQIGQAKALGKDYSDLKKQLDQVNAATQNVAPELKHLAGGEEEASSAAELMHHNHRQLHMLLGELGARSVPGLTEALMGLSMGPVGAVVAIAAAFELWKYRIEAAEKALGTVEIPDLTAGIDTANNLSTAWDGLARSVRNASDEYASAEAIHNRMVGSIQAELRAQHALIDATKNKALADLNVQRAGGMDQGEYERRKAIIERGADDATVQAEIAARNKELAAKRATAARAQQEAQQHGAAAAGIKDLGGPESTDEQVAAIIEDQKKVADAARKTQEEIGANRARLQNMQLDEKGRPIVSQNLPQDTTWWMSVYGTEPDTFNPLQQSIEQEKRARETADAAEKRVGELKRAAEKRKEEREKAAKAAALAQKTKEELAPEDDPNAANTPGTVAYENAQQAARQKDKGKATTINSDAAAFAADRKVVDADSAWLRTHAATPENVGEYRAKIQELLKAVADMQSAFTEIQNLGGDVHSIAKVLETTKREVADVRIIVERLNNHQNLP